MSETTIESSVETTETTAKPELNAVETIAYKQGWRPKESYKDDPKDWIDAETFLNNGPKYANKLKEKLEEQNKVIEHMNSSLSKIEERAYKKALQEIEEQKVRAKLTSDVSSYEAALKQETELKNEYKAQSQPAAIQTPEEMVKNSIEYKAFVREFPFVEKTDVDSVAKCQACRTVLENYFKSNPTASLQECFDNARKFIKNTFVFNDNESEESVPEVTKPSSTKSTNSSKPYVNKSVSEFEKSIGKLSPGSQTVARYMFKNNQDWKSFVKNVSRD